jgi:exodeoxyribonuclease VII large subunit
MGRQSKSQWDFGELFPPEATRRVLTVSELTAKVKGTLERDIGQVWVTGEITNFRLQSSGHCYFTLKDATSQLACVLFRGESVACRPLLEDGRKLIVQGELTVYEPRGQYQLVVRQVELQGVGALQLAFEKLKQKLQSEGLFAAERKRPLPKYPQRIGLVTSPTGAAIRDVLHVIGRRNPALEILFVPCRVQGEGAAAEIAAAIRHLNEFNLLALDPRRSPLDLILVTRGGGSLEDLWAFNEEVVARAIFESAIPVLSAVGHEIDFTISDFVADLRAATPSAAAEIITEGVFASREFVAGAPEWLATQVRRRMEDEREGLALTIQRLARLHPRRRLEENLQRLDDLQSGLHRSLKVRRREHATHWLQLHERLLALRPSRLLSQRQQSALEVGRRLLERGRSAVKERHNRVATADARLRLLSPEGVLHRGYSITMDAATGNILRDAAEVSAGQRLKTRLRQGELRSRVED